MEKKYPSLFELKIKYKNPIKYTNPIFTLDFKCEPDNEIVGSKDYSVTTGTAEVDINFYDGNTSTAEYKYSNKTAEEKENRD